MSLNDKITEFNRATTQSTTVTLDDVLQSMTDWRANKETRNEQIPAEIWGNIFLLLNKFSDSTICSALGIGRMQFQRKLDEHKLGISTLNKTSEIPRIDFCEAKEVPPSFYKPAKIPATNTLVVEFCRADGRIMKIHTTTDSFSELMKSFFSGGQHVIGHP